MWYVSRRSWRTMGFGSDGADEETLSKLVDGQVESEIDLRWCAERLANPSLRNHEERPAGDRHRGRVALGRAAGPVEPFMTYRSRRSPAGKLRVPGAEWSAHGNSISNKPVRRVRIATSAPSRRRWNARWRDRSPSRTGVNLELERFCVLAKDVPNIGE